MRTFLAAAVILIVLLFGEGILEAAIEFCPPLLIFIFAVAFIADGGCLASIGGGCLFLVGLVAFVAWLMWLFS